MPFLTPSFLTPVLCLQGPKTQCVQLGGSERYTVHCTHGGTSRGITINLVSTPKPMDLTISSPSPSLCSITFTAL